MEENIFKFLIQNSSDAIFMSDLQGNIIEVNNIACKVMGYSKEELTQMNFKEIKTPKYRQFFQENIRTLKKLKIHTYESELVNREGIISPFEIKSRLTEYNSNPVLVSMARNIKKRQEFEKKLLQTIIKTEEKERKRFAADLHDGLSPILSTIRLYADLLKKGKHKNTSKEELLNDIEELSEMAISTAKEIANNITPSILHDFGLAVAVQEFCKYVTNAQAIEIECRTEKFTDVKPNELVQSVLFQAIKELINNALKHSHATKIKLQLKSNNKQIILYYKDNGKGFDTQNALKKGNGLGLKNITNKINTIKGTCDFYSSENQGLIFTAVIKQ